MVSFSQKNNPKLKQAFTCFLCLRRSVIKTQNCQKVKLSYPLTLKIIYDAIVTG